MEFQRDRQREREGKGETETERQKERQRHNKILPNDPELFGEEYHTIS